MFSSNLSYRTYREYWDPYLGLVQVEWKFPSNEADSIHALTFLVCGLTEISGLKHSTESMKNRYTGTGHKRVDTLTSLLMKRHFSISNLEDYPTVRVSPPIHHRYYVRHRVHSLDPAHTTSRIRISVRKRFPNTKS